MWNKFIDLMKWIRKSVEGPIIIYKGEFKVGGGGRGCILSDNKSGSRIEFLSFRWRGWGLSIF